MSEAAPDATQRDTRGTLYLIPVALGEATPWTAFLPTQAQAIAAGLRRFVVETARAARAHLKQLSRKGVFLCIRCGYELTGNVSGRCRECGGGTIPMDGC